MLLPVPMRTGAACDEFSGRIQMANTDSFYELQEEDLDNVSAGQRQLNVAVVVRSSNQQIDQTGNQLEVIVNNRVRVNRTIAKLAD
jgi:hypothetical protein